MRTVLNGLTGAKGSATEFEESQISDETITELYVGGRLPAVILIPDSLDDQSNPNNEPPIAIVLGNFGAELRLHKVVSNDQERWGMTLGMEDIYGEYSYSVFMLKIMSTDPVKYPINSHIEDDNGTIKHIKVVNFATKFIEKFIYLYKVMNDSTKDWIPEVNVSRLSPWHKMRGKNIKGESVWEMGVYDKRGTGVMLGCDMPKDKMLSLQNALTQGYLEDPSTKYRQLANKYRRQQDFNTFCVFAVISFEHWVFREVRRALLNRGITEQQIDDQFYLETKGKKKNISREEAIALVTGNKAFKSNKHYQSFIDIVLDCRDSIVHGRKVEITEECADKMIYIIKDLMEYLAETIHPNSTLNMRL
ncbi:hypothetical protein [Psychrosphaera aestuarii]|uniref:hypothetical protein n=1 Tax=Psychrosphaera aestuarii TaxID=1266052 RepID=UPI001B326F1B|nr:hypothetical protein [Psychrosphaera aestuarii]